MWWLWVFDVAVAALAPIGNYWFTDADLGLQAGAGAIAVTTFFAVWSQPQGKADSNRSDALRDAIAAAFVVLYLVILAWSSFFNWLDLSSDGRAPVSPTLSPLTATFTTNFTALTGVVIAFYFSSKTVERVSQDRQVGRSSGAPSEEPEE